MKQPNMVPVIRQLDPLNAQARRDFIMPVGTTLQQCFDEFAFVVPEHQDLVVLLNGKPVMRAGWGYQVQGNDHVLIKPYPKGDDGYDGFKTLATFAVAAGAMYVGGPAGAALLIGGNLAINQFMPPPEPPSPQQIQGFSNTYQAQARGNVPKPMQPKPEQFGTLEVYPDEAARSYFAYEENKQVYYQLLCMGRGSFAVDLSTLRLGGDPITLFNNPQTQVVQQGGTLTLVNPTVTSVAMNQTLVPSQEMFRGDQHRDPQPSANMDFGVDNLIDGSNTAFHQIAGAARDDFLDVDAGDNIKFLNNKGEYSEVFTLTGVRNDYSSAVSHLLIDNAALDASTFDFCRTEYWWDATPPEYYRASIPIVWDTEFNVAAKNAVIKAIDSPNDITVIELDLAIPTGSGSVSFKVDYRLMDSANSPMGPWVNAGLRTINRSSSADLYVTETFNVPPGRYVVRVYRDVYLTTVTDQFFLSGLKGIADSGPNTTIAQDCTLLALKVEVPENKNITLGETRVVCTRLLPRLQFVPSSPSGDPFDPWNPARYEWTTPMPNADISAALAEALRIRYGASFEDYLMPLDELHGLQQVWSGRGDEFNGRFDQQLVMKEALQIIARAGRAVALEVGDKWTFVRDEAGVPSYPYSPANIVADENTAEPFFSVTHKYPLPDDPDGVIVEFFNRDVWEWDETPSYPTDALRPKRVRFFGVTEKNHAWRECCYLYYREVVKPSVVTWRTELEALNHGYGDIISIAPPKSQMYAGGVVEHYDSGTGTLTMSERLDFSGGGYYFINLRRDNGSMHGPYEVSAGASDYECVLKPGEVLAVEPHAGFDQTPQKDPTHFQFGKTATGLHVNLVGRKQVGDHLFELTGEVINPNRHTVDQTPYPT